MMDEPTAALTDHEVGRSLCIVRRLKNAGLKAIYIISQVSKNRRHRRSHTVIP